MKTSKRILASLLVAVMLVGVVPIGIFAMAEDMPLRGESEETFASDLGLNRIAQNLTSGEANEDYAISYVQFDDNTATVEMNNAEDCKVIVAAYNESRKKCSATAFPMSRRISDRHRSSCP